MSQKTITYLSIVIIVIGSIFLANGLILAWTVPGSAPPGGNVDAPLTGTLGTDGQWCTTDGSKVNCKTDAPSFSESDLQSVTDIGNTTDNTIIINNPGSLNVWGELRDIGNSNYYLDMDVNGRIKALSIDDNLTIGGNIRGKYLMTTDDTVTGGMFTYPSNHTLYIGAGNNDGDRHDIILYNWSCAQGSCNVPTIHLYGDTVSAKGNLNVGGGVTVNEGLTVGNAAGAYTYITLRDDESPNDVKYIHANSNVIGFLSGAGSWLTYWDNSGNMQNVGSINAGGNLNVGGGDVAISGKHAFRGNDTWLRLNQDGAFTSGVHTPGLFAPSALSVGIWSSPGANNAQIGGNFAVGNTVFARQGNSVELATDTTFGGVHDNHTGVRMFAYNMNGWSTANLGIQISNNWGSYGSVVARIGEFGIWTKGTYSSPYCDIAELFEPSQKNDGLESGDIVVLDEEEEKKIKKSSHSYSTLIVGVVSTNPNMTMGLLEDNSNEDHPPVALLGRVPTKVTTENGPIKIGDLIVSSSKPGYGMRCEDYDKCQGAVVGKATENLESGEGLIEVLIKGGF